MERPSAPFDIAALFDPKADHKRLKGKMLSPHPKGRYGILFTPRSGSSWLTSILLNSQALGAPAEWFNPSLMPASSRVMGARSLDQFTHAIQRHDLRGGLFGFEITHHQLEAVFGTAEAFMAHFQGSTFFWLIREDIVAQAVSLQKMVQTQVTHTANIDAEKVEKADQIFDYDDKGILHWTRHILNAERATEAMIKRFGLTPIRLSYEQMMAAGPSAVVKYFAHHLGQTDRLSTDQTSSEHRKIGTAKNDAFAERFRKNHPILMRKIAFQRRKMLSQIPPITT